MHQPGTAFDRLWPQLLEVAHGGRAAGTVSMDGLGALEARLARLYLDFLAPHEGGLAVLAHLGQSLDGRIATDSGHSTFVTGEANLVHMHRLRALSDAVLVGGGTVALDDPRLTVRLVEGPSPMRVVIDTGRRLAGHHRIFQTTPPETLVLCCSKRTGEPRPGGARVLGVTAGADGCLSPASVLEALRRQGVRRLFIEGGGVTVSRFLAAGCLDHLHLCVAPVIIGSGREALRLAPIDTMQEALRLETEPVPMGGDWLFACRLRRRPLAQRSARQPQQVAMADEAAPAVGAERGEPLGAP
ncbi:RibD family protein [Marinimicrococcus flavescens]|uniref:RibD family protein n=1 Tax=Marinimicrococcus flavescens TaxID=3031815 RepID=A0AAP3XTQ4_9PROT|nr:RibD family protein [Marinimicrococcus flavescens]